MSPPVQDSSRGIAARDESQDGIGLPIGRDDERTDGSRSHEDHVEADVVQREDSAPVGVVDKRLDQRIDADLDSLSRDAEKVGSG